MNNKDLSAKGLAELLGKTAPEDFEKVISVFLTDIAASHKSESDKAIQALTKERDTALSTIADMSEQIAAQSKITEDGKKIVSIGKDKYFLEGGPFTFPGKGSVSADDLAKDEKLLKALVEKKSGILRKVDK